MPVVIELRKGDKKITTLHQAAASAGPTSHNLSFSYDSHPVMIVWSIKEYESNTLFTFILLPKTCQKHEHDLTLESLVDACLFGTDRYEQLMLEKIIV